MTGVRRTEKLVRRAAVHGCGAAFHGDLVEVAVDGGGDDAGCGAARACRPPFWSIVAQIPTARQPAASAEGHAAAGFPRPFDLGNNEARLLAHQQASSLTLLLHSSHGGFGCEYLGF